MEEKEGIDTTNNTNGAPKKSATIMEGGAMRGMFTCGVIDVFMENGIDFDGACGISAGAVFGCNIKSHQIGRAIRYNKKYSKDPRYCSFRSLIKTGDLYGAEIKVEFVDFLRPEYMFENIEALENQIAKDCEEAKAYFRKKAGEH